MTSKRTVRAGPSPLAYWRFQRQLSLLELSQRSGIGLTKLWRLEHRYDVPTRQQRAALARALRVKASVLFEEPNDDPPRQSH